MKRTQKNLLLFLVAIMVTFAVLLVIRNMNRFVLPEGETLQVTESTSENSSSQIEENAAENQTNNSVENARQSDETDSVEPIPIIRENPEPQTDSEGFFPGEPHSDSNRSKRPIFQTDETLHSVPLEEIQAGGPPKDGIPSIDDPVFISSAEADEFLDDVDDIGLGVVVGQTARFYPYQILVFHEIVNDIIEDRPVAVTYCPLCATGVVFDSVIDGQRREFGVSGLLWQSNVLMYDRTGDANTESLWSQVLGEAVLGPETGRKFAILPSDTIRYGQWKQLHPNTEVLSKATGEFRNYGNDPYGNYYENEDIIFGDFAFGFTDERLHPKEFVIGLEVNRQAKAYPLQQLPEGETTDFIDDIQVTIQKNGPVVNAFIDEDMQPLSTIDGFWFSWLSAHPQTLLWESP